MSADWVYNENPTLFLERKAIVLQDSGEKAGIVAWGLLPSVLITGVYAGTFDSWIGQIASLAFVPFWLVIDVLGKGRRIQIHKPFLFLFAWLFWQAFCDVAAGAGGSELGSIFARVASSIKVFGFALIVANVIPNRESVKPLLLALALTPVAHVFLQSEAIAAVDVELRRGAVSEDLRLTELGNANRNAMNSNLALLSCVALFLTTRNKLLRFAPLVFVPIILFYLARLGSRTGMATVLVLSLGFWFLYLKPVSKAQGRSIVWPVIIGLLLFAGAIAWFVTSPFFYRFEDLGYSYKTDRFALMVTGLGFWLESPLLGHGTFGFKLKAAQHGIGLGIAHNLPTDLLVRGGLPALILYYGAWYCLVALLWKLRKRVSDLRDFAMVNIGLLMCGTYLIASLTGAPWNPRSAYFLIGGVIGYAYALRARLDTQEAFPSEEDEYSAPQWHAG